MCIGDKRPLVFSIETLSLGQHAQKKDSAAYLLACTALSFNLVID